VLAQLQSRLRALFSEDNYEDGLYAFLVKTPMLASATLISALLIGAAVVFSASLISGDSRHWALAIAMVVLCAWRYKVALDFAKSPTQDDRSTLVYYDGLFFIGSVGYALLVGLTNFLMLTWHTDPGAFAFATAVTVGFTMSYSSRSASRVSLMTIQMVLTTAPPIIHLLILPVKNGAVYAAVLAFMVPTAFVMGLESHRRMVALYRANAETARRANTDLLTGLHNRAAFNEALPAAINATMTDQQHALALLLIDLDRFKEVNDLLGHGAGDAVIAETGRRLAVWADRDASVARLGGDEFVALLRYRRDEADEILSRAEHLSYLLHRPFEMGETIIDMGASIGLAHCPRHASDADTLMKYADVALYEAKKAGRGKVCVFDENMQAEIEERRAIESRLDNALRLGAFEPFFQPIIDIPTNQTTGFEALARWRIGDQFISTERFVSIAENNGKIIDISEMILKKACCAAASWPAPTSVSVNLSPMQFRDPERLRHAVRDALAQSGLAPDRLYLEITETLLMENPAQAREAMQAVAREGVLFALDDFGVGYSSLSYINDFPFSRIKIDKKFIEHIVTDNASASIVAAVAFLARRLDLNIVAEGVETEAQAFTLLSLGVTQAQGFRYGRPTEQETGLARAEIG
jgi:diguanylate cyclase (GGDEF)-like protein